jgi:hypothetical protein
MFPDGMTLCISTLEFSMLPGICVFYRYSLAVKRAWKLLPMLAISGMFLAGRVVAWGQATAPAPYDFGAVPANTSSTQTLTFSFTGAATIGSVPVVTEGVSGKDFQPQANDTSATLCAGRSFSSGDTCTVDVTFSPLGPGHRIGEIQLLDGIGNLLATAYISGWGQGALLVSGSPTVSTIAGIDNTSGYNYNPASNTSAAGNQLNGPRGVVTDLSGNIYIADALNNVIRQVTPAGIISTVAGVQGQAPSKCQAFVNAPALTTPAFSAPGGSMAIDAAGNLIVGDYELGCLYRVNLQAETITTIMGMGGPNDDPTTTGVPGPASDIEFWHLGGVAVDGAGDIYVGISGYLVKIAPNNHVTAVAGSGTAGTYLGEGGPALSAQIDTPFSIIFDSSGLPIFTDFTNSRVLKVDNLGKIHTILGGGTSATSSLPASGSSSSVLGTHVKAGFVWGVAIDGPGNLYATSTQYGQIIELDPSGFAYLYSGTAAGTALSATDETGDGGAPGSATLSAPSGLWIAPNGDMLVADEFGSDVRRIGYTPLAEVSLNFAATPIGHKSSDSPQSAAITNIGNAPLTYATPASGTNPSISSSFSVDPVSTCQLPSPAPTGVLGLDASCTYAVDFIPLTSGPISGALTIAGNIFGTNSIALSGTGIKVVDTLVVTAPATTVAGTPITVNVIAYLNGSVSTAFTGPLTITSTDGKAILPASVNLTAGVGSFSATLETTGIQTITATDIGGVSGTSNNILVTAASPFQILPVSGSPQSTIIGSAFPAPLKVEVLDQYGNSVGGATVSFAAPASGASATFSSATCSTSTTTPVGYCSVIATANGTASSTAYNVSASVSGVANPATFSLTNLQALSTLTLTPSGTPLVYGQPVALSAVISPASAGGSVPTGIITFLDGATTLSPTVAVSGAAASYTVSVPTVGTHPYNGKYSGDSNFIASVTAAPSSVVVNKATATVAGQPATVAYGQAGSVPVTVTGQYSGVGILPPGGTVSYVIVDASNTSVGSGTLPIVSGGVSVPVGANLPPGSYIVNVTYSGDANYLGTTAPVSLQVGQIQPVIKWVAPSPITYGTTLAGVLNATAFNGASVVSGNYVYSSGAAAVTASTVLPAGPYTLSVNFTPSDTAIYKGATGSVSLVVNKALPGVSLASSANPALLKNPTTLTATVSSTVSMPSGTVTFLDGTTPLGSGPLVNGVASLTVSSLATGPHTIVATYSGDSNFLAASSNSLAQHIDDFTIAPGSSTSHTILPGDQASYQFTLTPVGDATFPSDISLTMDGQPTNATITFNPTGINAGTGTAQFSVTVATPSLTGAAHPAPSFGKGAGPLALALLLLPFSRRLRRQARKLGRLGPMLLLMIAAGAALLGATGCGSRTGFFATQPQTYTLTVTGASGALSHSASVTLTVE